MITISLLNNEIHVKDKDKTYRVRPPFFTLRRYRNIRNRSVITGFVGSRGSGKSVGGARLTIVDHILLGRTNVWSNMDIGFILKRGSQVKEFHTNPISKLNIQELDRLYSDGLIFFDEVNMDIADSRRSNNKETLAFDYVVQQLRKRRLNIIWTAQSEMHVESRLRSQTDIFIKCTDISLTNPKCGIGELTKVKCYDYSGLVNEELPNDKFDGVFGSSVVWNKPWWNSYSTFQLQGLEEETKEAPVNAEVEATMKEILEYVNAEGSVSQLSVWAKWSIREETDKRQIRKLLNSNGVLSTNNSRKFTTEEYYAENLT